MVAPQRDDDVEAQHASASIPPAPGGRRAGRPVVGAFRSRGPWREWVSERVVGLVLRLERAGRVGRDFRGWPASPALDLWAEDQAFAVAELAQGLPLDPSGVATRLRQTPAGVGWLVARWRDLARLEPVGWTAAHRRHAADLLGGDAATDPTAPGFAAARADELEADLSRIEEADALLRGLVEAGLGELDGPDPR